jgi:hypothetical protein
MFADLVPVTPARPQGVQVRRILRGHAIERSRCRKPANRLDYVGLDGIGSGTTYCGFPAIARWPEPPAQVDLELRRLGIGDHLFHRFVALLPLRQLILQL